MRALKKFSLTGKVLAVVCGLLAVASGVWLGRADERVLNQIPKREAQGRPLRLEHHMALGFQRAAWAGVLVGLAGVATAPWWGRRSTTMAESTGSRADDGETTGLEGAVTAARTGRVWPSGWIQPVPWRLVVVVGVLAMVVSGALRWPRLGHSFWSDEAYAARVYVWGVKVPEADGSLVFKPVAWREAMFLNERANNQVWCSIEARAAHAVWRAMGGHPADVFSERVLRMPAFLWGLLTIGAVTVLGTMLAGRTGAAAGMLLAVHPWHVRFGAEMRGYSAMLLALALGIIFLLLAMRDGRWRWWLLTAAMNLWALLAFAGSAHVPLVFCGTAAGVLVWRRRWDWLARMVVANALAAVVFLWIYGPSISQLSAFLRRGSDVAAYTVSWPWLRHFGESLCLGVPWSVMSEAWKEATWLPSATVARGGMAVVAVLAGARVVMALWSRPRLLVVPGLLTVAAGISIAQSVAAGTILLTWYLLPVVLGWVLVLGMGAGSVAAGPAAPWHRALNGVIVAVCFSLWVSVAVAMRRVPRQPMREAGISFAEPTALWPGVRLTSGTIDRDGSRTGDDAGWAGVLATAREDAVLAVVGVSDHQMPLYAPGVRIVKSIADLEQAEAAAAAEGRRLWVSVGGWESTQQRLPEVTSRLQDGAYEWVADLPGAEPMFSYQVWRQR